MNWDYEQLSYLPKEVVTTHYRDKTKPWNPLKTGPQMVGHASHDNRTSREQAFHRHAELHFQALDPFAQLI
jgi:hypothetical protein